MSGMPGHNEPPPSALHAELEPPIVLGLVVRLPIQVNKAALNLLILLDRNLERLAYVVAFPECHALIKTNMDLDQVARAWWFGSGRVKGSAQS